MPRNLAFQYVDLNVGVENVSPLPFTAVYMDFNVGIAVPDVRYVVEYVDLHIGLEQKPVIGAEYVDYNVYVEPVKTLTKMSYVDLNIVTDETPVPHIWFVKPQQGKEGLLFNIVGQGFGVTQEEFLGKVRLGEMEVPVTRWDLRPADKTPVLRASGYVIGETGFNDLHWASLRGYWKSGNGQYYGPVIPENLVVLKQGDIIEFDYRQLHPGPSMDGEIEIVPYFQKMVIPRDGAGSSSNIANSWSANDTNPLLGFTVPHFVQLGDQNGLHFGLVPALAQGQQVHRRFIVPPAFDNVPTTNWGVAMVGVRGAADRPARSVEYSNFVIRDTAGVPKFWVTGDDGSPLNVRSGRSTSDQAGKTGQVTLDPNWKLFGTTYRPNAALMIDYGVANVEHEHIVAVVPDGAESGMVRVVLEDG